jgi:hypothetical protein
MNEQIKLLKEQSMEWVPNMADPDTKIRLLNAEKFAELIVKECTNFLKDTMDDHFAAEQLEEHFGVEE